MRRGLLIGAMLVALGASHTVTAAADDFSPTGRRRPGGVRRPPQPRPTGGSQPKRTTKKKKKSKRKSLTKQIKRYRKIVLKRPDEAFPLRRLIEVYRKRDGNLKKLYAYFEKRAKPSHSAHKNARLALAGIYLQTNRTDDAKRLLDEAIASDPNHLGTRMLLARLAEARQDNRAARKHYEAIVGRLKKGAERERITRILMGLAIDEKDFVAAKKYHRALLKASGPSLFVQKEYADALMKKRHYGRAEKEYRRAVRGASGDNRALAPALRDLGRALAKQKKMPEALKVLKRARRAAGSQAGVRNEILALLTDVFREQGQLVELIVILKEEGGRDFHRLKLIGTLYEETGQVNKAIATLREAIRLKRRSTDTRIKLVHLLQTAGQLDEAVAEYRKLIKVAPRNYTLVFELADILIQRGDRKGALQLAKDLERKSKRDEEVLAAVVDFYERNGETLLAKSAQETLANVPNGDPVHLADLGSRYFDAGDSDKALKTWERVRRAIRDPARAASTLGDIYLNHNLVDRGIKSLRSAVKLKPKSREYRKQLATALERAALERGRSRRSLAMEALSMWRALLAEAVNSPSLARESRTHIVGILASQHLLKGQLAPLKRKFNRTPPDAEAGKLLAEVLRRLHRHDDATVIYRKLSKDDPGDESVLLALERSLLVQRKLDDAIKILQKLAELNPKRARQYYQRMAKYSAELYRDDDAIKYATLAVELSPNDAQGHFRLGEMHQKRQDTKRAVAQFRKAIQKDDRLFAARFALADLLLGLGQVDEADLLYQQVLRKSRDDQFIQLAARASMQLNLGRGQLATLEHTLLPLTLGHPRKPLYRRLLIDVYAAMALPLVQRARSRDPKKAADAKLMLQKMGSRGVKPLLDALSDTSRSQQRTAIEVLGHVRNKSAGATLFRFATGDSEPTLRTRAMLSCGVLRDELLLEKYEGVLLAGDSVGKTQTVVAAAAWGVANLRSEKARPLLRRMTSVGSPAVRAFGVIGLSLLKRRRARRGPSDLQEIANLVTRADSGVSVKSAALFGLGLHGSAADLNIVLPQIDDARAEVQAQAMIASARIASRLGPKPSEAAPRGRQQVARALAEALTSHDADVRRRALSATGLLFELSNRSIAAKATAKARLSTAALDPSKPSIHETLAHLSPLVTTAEHLAQGLLLVAPQLKESMGLALSRDPRAARAATVAMDRAFLNWFERPEEVSVATRTQLANLAEAITGANVASLVALVDHPSAALRTSTLALLSGRSEPATVKMLEAQLTCTDVADCRSTLAALQLSTTSPIIGRVAEISVKHPAWSVRAAAVEALGRAGRADSKSTFDKLRFDALVQTAVHDSFAIVREVAVRALAANWPIESRALLETVAKSDSELQLRTLSLELLKKTDAK